MKRRIIFVLAILCMTLLSNGKLANAWKIAFPNQDINASETHSPYNHPITESIQNLEIDLGEPGFSLRHIQTFGVSEEPYPADTQHLNWPRGITVDPDTDKFYVVEEIGFRLLVYNEIGQNSLIVGRAGQPWHGKELPYPKDVVVDENDHMWVVANPAILEYDETGQYLQIFPADEPWVSGTDNDRFNDPRGIAIDADGKLYIADTGNHRIQVYDVSSGSPIYLSTIGITDTPKSDNSGFDLPRGLALDSSGRLYVMDVNNYRIQRCAYTVNWVCETFFGETDVPGDDLTHMNWSNGLFIDGSDQIYIADGSNYRVLKCDTLGNCSVFAGVTGVSGRDNTHFDWPADTAVDSLGNVYVSDYDGLRVQKFDKDGNYLTTLGEVGVPYLADSVRYNKPWGVGIAPDESIYIVENAGYRLIKLNPEGEQLWVVGEAGIPGSDNIHFGTWGWEGPEGNPAVDELGRVYISDSVGNRVQIYDSNGNFLYRIGIDQEAGDDNEHLANPYGVAINPINQDIFIADTGNQRVQIFTKDRVYKTTLGITGVTGEDDLHFNGPRDVTVDQDGNIFVADFNNFRIQKCTLGVGSYSCTTFVGETGVFNNDFGHFAPLSVDVDQFGRVYIADEWNNRLMVYDQNGAFLTIVGQSWGGVETSSFYNPSGVAVDHYGNVYVADYWAHRVQKYAPYVSGWKQLNINGFGLGYRNPINSLSVHDGYLYAGTWSEPEVAQIWRMNSLGTWSEYSPPWNNANSVVWDMVSYGDKLYACTYNFATGGEIWRLLGDTWEQIVSGGFGDPNNISVRALASFSGYLYAVTTTDSGFLKIYRSVNGDLGTWTAVVEDSLGSVGIAQDVVLEIYDQELYLGIGRNGVAELWHTTDGTIWTSVFTNGLDDNNSQVSAIAEFDGELYIGMRNIETGGEVWRSPDGINFSRVVTNGLGNQANIRPYGLITYDDKLYLAFSNPETGGEIWSTSQGLNWERISDSGFGDSNNKLFGYFDKGMAIFKEHLNIATLNWTNGGEVWMMLDTVYLPVIVR